MSPLLMGGAKVKAISANELSDKAGALQQALDSGGAELDPARRAAAETLVTKVDERTSKAGNHTVVALAGATGSGKSSLFNALVGEQVATVGARRPTTSKPVAAVWGPEDAGPLLDWLQVPQRHHVETGVGASGGSARRGDGAPNLDGLVLLDLPDFDSRVVEHREESERVLELVDVFVWVTDPQKYADARLHHDFLSALATHDAVTVVVLNQADRLRGDALAQVRQDLSRLAEADGIGKVQVVATSATSGDGVDELRHRLATAVAAQNAARHRLAADIRSTADKLRADVGDKEASVKDKDKDLVEALGRAAGIPVVVSAVERDYRNQAWGRTGWPFTRWVRALRPDPLKRLRLNATDETDQKLAVTAGDVRTVLGRSSLPPPTPAARSAVELATRRVGDEASVGLPVRWSQAVSDAATPPGPDLADALDQAVVSTSLRMRPPVWWRVFGLAQLVLAVVTVLGLLWLVLLAVMGWLQLPQLETPKLWGLPWPFLMFVGGLVLGLVLAGLARWFARVGARRRGASVRKRLTEAVSEVARERILAPVQQVLERHRATREALTRAAS
jgi:GTP-binding protein EngB required for normal cell division